MEQVLFLVSLNLKLIISFSENNDIYKEIGNNF
jgi:hypothetical protein